MKILRKMNISLPKSKANKPICANADANAASSDYYTSEGESEQGDNWHREREENIITDDPISSDNLKRAERINYIGNPDLPWPFEAHGHIYPEETYHHRCIILEKGWQGMASMPQMPGKEGREYEQAKATYWETIKSNLRERSRISASLARIDGKKINVQQYRDLLLQTTDHRNELGMIYFGNKIDVYPAYGSIDNPANKAVVQRKWGNSLMLRGMAYCEQHNIAIIHKMPPRWIPDCETEMVDTLPSLLFTSKKACIIQAEAGYDRVITPLRQYVTIPQIERLVVELNDYRRHLAIPPAFSSYASPEVIQRIGEHLKTVMWPHNRCGEPEDVAYLIRADNTTWYHYTNLDDLSDLINNLVWGYGLHRCNIELHRTWASLS